MVGKTAIKEHGRRASGTDVNKSVTVIEHVLDRLRDIGVKDVFGVAGDYAFSIDDALVNRSDIRYIGCCNELNAAYAADGYARIHGVGALTTTYGVGELSAINGIGGAYAEHVPVFHLVGMPSMPTQQARALMHHTLGNGEYNLFQHMAQPVVCATAIMTPQNVAYETERLIAEAFYHRRPVYMAFPADLANQPVLSKAQTIEPPTSDPASLAEATDAVVARLKEARNACILPGVLVARAGLRDALQLLVDASGLPFATMMGDKSVLDEQQPSYIGMYVGKLTDEAVRNYVETCDRVLTVGTLMTDFNTGAFTARIEPDKIINIGHHHVSIGAKVYPNIEMADILNSLAKRVTKRSTGAKVKPPSLGPIVGSGKDAISAEALYPRWGSFIKPNDILITETGSSSMGMALALLSKGATFHNQTLWGSIGWATPAAFGAAIAAPDKRVILITGEGSHQLTAQEISQFGRLGLKPIVFVLNNSGYLVERLLCKDPTSAYNDIAQWRYSEIPHALGCDGWLTARVTTCEEFDQILKSAQSAKNGAYIEVVTDAYAAPPLMKKIHESTKSLYPS